MTQEPVAGRGGSPNVAYDVAMLRLEEQMRQIDAIDNKISVMLAAASAIMALFAGFLAVVIRAEDTASLAVGVVFIALTGLFYVPGTIAGILAYRFYRWDLRPNWDDLLDYSASYPEPVMRRWVAEACVVSLKGNVTPIDRKLERAGWQMRLLAAQTVAASSGLLALIIANGVSVS